jgi:hypothetical protein
MLRKSKRRVVAGNPVPSLSLKRPRSQVGPILRMDGSYLAAISQPNQHPPRSPRPAELMVAEFASFLKKVSRACRLQRPATLNRAAINFLFGSRTTTRRLGSILYPRSGIMSEVSSNSLLNECFGLFAIVEKIASGLLSKRP